MIGVCGVGVYSSFGGSETRDSEASSFGAAGLSSANVSGVKEEGTRCSWLVFCNFHVRSPESQIVTEQLLSLVRCMRISTMMSVLSLYDSSLNVSNSAMASSNACLAR
jgi:hypothetical protein